MKNLSFFLVPAPAQSDRVVCDRSRFFPLLSAQIALLGLVLGVWPMTVLAQSTYEPYTFTTLAGLAGSSGSADGTGSAAQFNGPAGVAVDSAGNIYVADSGNNTIRKVTPAGVVTTLAGTVGEMLGVFRWPAGVAVDNAGNVYVADSAHCLIQKVTPSGTVTTLAGAIQYDQHGNPAGGNVDGTGSAARFNGPVGVAVDSAGNVYVADSGNYTIRKVTPTGVVTTLAGWPYRVGSDDGVGSTVRFSGPSGITVDSAGNIYVADSRNNTIRKGYPQQLPAVIATSVPGFGFNAGRFGFTLTGPAGRSVVVDTSTNLTTWQPIWTNTFTGSLQFTDPQSGLYSNRFYRAHTP